MANYTVIFFLAVVDLTVGNEKLENTSLKYHLSNTTLAAAITIETTIFAGKGFVNVPTTINY